MNLTIESSAFNPNTTIPQQYTCDGANDSPPLTWKGGPEETKSYVLIVDDPDAPNGTWVHWLLFNIPADTHQLTEKNHIPNGAITGKNSWGNSEYGGPCPPSGRHRYFFKLYALDTVLKLDENARKEDLLNAMENHILAKAELIGLYR